MKLKRATMITQDDIGRYLIEYQRYSELLGRLLRGHTKVTEGDIKHILNGEVAAIFYAENAVKAGIAQGFVE